MHRMAVSVCNLATIGGIIVTELAKYAINFLYDGIRSTVQ